MQYMVLAAALLSLAAFLKVQYGRPRTNPQAKLSADDDERV
jgi:hypothetical protein